MIVVMPAGHTRRGPRRQARSARTATEEFVKDFITDVMPYVEKHYRVLTDRNNTAIAGPVDGRQPDAAGWRSRTSSKFGYIGVYSSGLLGAFPGLGGRPWRRLPRRRPRAAAAPPAAAPAAPPAAAPRRKPPTAAEWEKANAKTLDNAGSKKGLKVLWFATGKEDGLITTTQATVDLLKKHGFSPVFKETPGGHTWINWRNYLNEFVPQLFQ